jgi:hypothetical protein
LASACLFAHGLESPLKFDLRVALSPLLLVVFLSGCNSGSSSSEASVRLVNASSDFSTLDLYALTTEVSAGVATYTAGSYVSVDAGTYTFNLNAGGTGVTSATTSQAVASNVAYSLIAYTTGLGLTTQVLTDDEPAPASGTAKFRIFNTDPVDAGDVDVYVIGTACSALSSSSASATEGDVTGLQSAYTEITAAAAGTAYHVCVTGAGDKTDLRLDIPALTLTDQQITTLILVRSTGGVLLHGLLLNQESTLTPELNTSARMRLAVGASASAQVTATANGVTLGTDLAAPAVTSYQLVPAGALTMAVTVAGDAATATGLSAAAGGDFTLLVIGTAASTPVLLTDDNTVSTSTTEPTKMRLVNGMTGTNSTASLAVNFNAVGAGAVYGAASTYALEPASAALAQIEATFGSTELCLSTDVTLSAGSVYTVFLLGDAPAVATTCALVLDR